MIFTVFDIMLSIQKLSSIQLVISCKNYETISLNIGIILKHQQSKILKLDIFQLNINYPDVGSNVPIAGRIQPLNDNNGSNIAAVATAVAVDYE